MTRVVCRRPSRPDPRVRPVVFVTVSTLSDRNGSGYLRYGFAAIRASLGKTGVRAVKREGDSATPMGFWAISAVLYRRDRVARPRSSYPVYPIRPDDGWCDAPKDRNYNRPVTLPYPASAERLWRKDNLYDVVAVLDHNECPRMQGVGSAIFLHAARKGYAPTAGCIAVSLRDLRRLLAAIPKGTRFAAGRNLRRQRGRRGLA